MSESYLTSKCIKCWLKGRTRTYLYRPTVTPMCVPTRQISASVQRSLLSSKEKKCLCAKTNRDPWVLMFIVGTWFCCTKVREIKLAQYLDVCVRAYVFLRILKSGQYARDLLLAVITWIGWFRFTCWRYSWSYLDHMGESSSLLLRKWYTRYYEDNNSLTIGGFKIIGAKIFINHV